MIKVTQTPLFTIKYNESYYKIFKIIKEKRTIWLIS